MARMEHLEAAARKKLSAPDGWRAYKFECIADCYLIEGSVPVGVYARGPRKGQPKWSGDGDQTILTRDDVEKANASYQATTGNCGECMGTGKEFVSWSKKDGLVQRPCAQCRGTGKLTPNT